MNGVLVEKEISMSVRRNRDVFDNQQGDSEYRHHPYDAENVRQ